jgi:S1-C subfamily serine protease
MHSGASGGPIVNEEGVALGVLTQRAITPAHQSNNSN